MSFLGMGTLEVLAVLLVAFIFLGPERIVDAARLLGKVTRQARRMTTDLQGVLLDEEEASSESAKAHRHDEHNRQPDVASIDDAGRQQRRDPDTSGDTSAPSSLDDTPPAEGDGPVAFRPAAGTITQGDVEPAPERKQP